MEISQSNLTAFNKTNISKQSNASRMTPNEKKTAKLMVIKDNKEPKDMKSTKINKVSVLKPTPSLPFKGVTKLAQYSYNKTSSNRNVEPKPVKPIGVSKFLADIPNSKQ